MKKLRFFHPIWLFLAMVMVYGFSDLSRFDAHAAADLEGNVKNTVDEAKKDAKKTGRKIKKRARDATGNGSTKKDIEDKVKDVKDEAETKARKMRREKK